MAFTAPKVFPAFFLLHTLCSQDDFLKEFKECAARLTSLSKNGSLNGEREPSISIVGSSNYTKRSYSLDLEVGTVILTSDDGLKRQLREERDGLEVYAQNVGIDEFVKTERRVGIHVRVAMWIVGLVGGAL
jgi:hypothetical protein